MGFVSFLSCRHVLIFLSMVTAVVLMSYMARSNAFWTDVNGNPLQIKIDDVSLDHEDVMDWDFATGTPSKVVRGSLDEHVDR